MQNGNNIKLSLCAWRFSALVAVLHVSRAQRVFQTKTLMKTVQYRRCHHCALEIIRATDPAACPRCGRAFFTTHFLSLLDGQYAYEVAGVVRINDDERREEKARLRTAKSQQESQQKESRRRDLLSGWDGWRKVSSVEAAQIIEQLMKTRNLGPIETEKCVRCGRRHDNL